MNVNPEKIANQAEEVKFRSPFDEAGWAMVSHLLTEDGALSDGAFRTYAVLLKFAQQKKKLWAGVDTLARLRHRNAATISRHLAELQARKLITRKRRLGTSWITIIEDVTEIYAAKIQSCRNARLEIAKMRDQSSQECNGKKNKQKENEKIEKKCVPPSADTRVPSPKTHAKNFFSKKNSSSRQTIADRQVIANKVLQIAYGVPFGDEGLADVQAGRIEASARRTAYHVAGELLKDVESGAISRDLLDDTLEDFRSGEGRDWLDSGTDPFEAMTARKRCFRVLDALSDLRDGYRGAPGRYSLTLGI